MPKESLNVVQLVGQFIQGTLFRYIVGGIMAVFSIAIIIASFTATWVKIPEAAPNLQAHTIATQLDPRGIAISNRLQNNDIILKINDTEVEAAEDGAAFQALYAREVERSLADGKSTITLEVLRFGRVSQAELPIQQYQRTFELDFTTRTSTDLGFSTSYVPAQDFPHLEGASITLMELWQGGNDNIPTLDLANLLEGKSGFDAVRSIDRLLIVLPLGAAFMLVVIALYVLGIVSPRRSLVVMLAISFLLLVFPYIWQVLSANAWRGYLAANLDAQDLTNFVSVLPPELVETFNLNTISILPRIGAMSSLVDTPYPILTELVSTHQTSNLMLPLLLTFIAAIAAFTLMTFEQNNMFINTDRFVAFLVLTPSIMLLAIFVYFFIGENIATSFSDWGEEAKGAPPPFTVGLEKTFVGTENYQDLMTDLTEFRFRTSLINNFFFTVFFLLGCLLFGFLLAFLVDQKVKGEGLFRTIFLFPMSLSFVVTGTVWNWMLQPKGGLNVLPSKITNLTIGGTHIFPEFIRSDPLTYKWLTSKKLIWGFEWADTPRYLTYAGLILLGIVAVNYLIGRDWRTIGIVLGIAAFVYIIFAAGFWDNIWIPVDNPATEIRKGYNVALTGIIIAAVWQMSGYVMALFLAGIRGVSDELREAARVDGCAEWQVYLYIILPSLRPIVVSAVIILGHISLKIFDLVFAMSKPDVTETMVPGVLLYTKSFRGNRLASGSAIAVIMLVLVSLVIIPYLWSSLRSEESQA